MCNATGKLRGLLANLFVLAGLIAPCLFVAQAKIGEVPDIKLSANLVMLDVTVTDKKNLLLKNLTRNHFAVLDDNVKQPIAFFSDQEEPVSLGILLDVSGSMRFHNSKDKGQPIHTFRAYFPPFLKLNHPLNEYFIMSFNNQPQVLSDWTKDKDVLIESVKKISSPKGATALYDACVQAMEKIKSATNRKHAIILLSDGGGDNNSKQGFKEVKRFVKESDVRFYPITVVPTDYYEDPSSRFNQVAMREIAALSGGTHFFVIGEENVIHPLNQILAEFEQQYTIGYYPPKSDNKWHEVKVKIAPLEIIDTSKPDRLVKKVEPIVRTRQGYFAN